MLGINMDEIVIFLEEIGLTMATYLNSFFFPLFHGTYQINVRF